MTADDTQAQGPSAVPACMNISTCIISQLRENC